jgi:hypothetical protein
LYSVFLSCFNRKGREKDAKEKELIEAVSNQQSVISGQRSVQSLDRGERRGNTKQGKENRIRKKPISFFSSFASFAPFAVNETVC